MLHAADDPAVPWRRVVRADGSLAKGERQRALLEAEGVPFAPGDRGRHARGTIARPMWLQRELTLRPRDRAAFTWSPARCVERAARSCASVRVGLLHLFIRHTSASLTLNENASPDVRDDFETWFNAAVPEGFGGWTHTLEGPDDMPAHIKASLLGPSLTLPVARGRARAGHLAGRLPVRAPRPRRRAVAARDAARASDG